MTLPVIGRRGGGRARVRASGQLAAEGAGPVIEPGGEFVGDGGGAGGCALGPGQVMSGELRQGQALQAAVQDAGDGPGLIHRRGGDLADEHADVVSGELGGAELLLEGLAGVLALVPPGFCFGKPGCDLLVDVGVEGLLDGGGPQGEQVTGSAGPAARRLGGGREQDNRERGPDGYQLRRAACRVSLLDQGTVASRDGAGAPGGPRQNPAHGAPDAAPAQRRRS